MGKLLYCLYYTVTNIHRTGNCIQELLQFHHGTAFLFSLFCADIFFDVMPNGANLFLLQILLFIISLLHGIVMLSQLILFLLLRLYTQAICVVDHKNIDVEQIR